MLKVVILGAGNVASHLCKAFVASKEVSVVQVYHRNKKSLHFFPTEVDTTTCLLDIKDADIYIIAIADDAIKPFSKGLPITKKLVVHTSGSKAMNKLSNTNRKGVFYPLQTFSKKKAIDFSEIPICLEAENETDLKLLKKLGDAISKNVQIVNSEKRAKLHLAAVFVNNFVNYLYQVGSDLLLEDSLSFDLLKPLIKETAAKIETLKPTDCQTGPAKRNDLKTIENHLHLLEDSPYRDLYQKLTKAIQQNYNHG